jgi:TolB-like protein/Tfp pilus assembly protein PilF
LERRLAAILAADVVGYTRLMGADETGTLERLKSLRTELVQPKIAERKGRIVKLMGDGLLAEFPSAVEAVNCAVDLQRSLASYDTDTPDEYRIRLRIGVNLGDVIVEGADIYGDGVNIATRLEALAEPQGICISAGTFDAIDGKVDADFEDFGKQRVKNIAKPIRVYRWTFGGVQGGPPTRSAEPSVLPDKPSIAVLPFTNMSGDPEQQYFSDGITEDIITELSRFTALEVVARNSTFVYRDQAVDVSAVGRKLGARYLLEGSLRKASNRIRLTAQLIDVQTNKHVWAERYDRELEDIFSIQDELVHAIVATLAGRLADADAKRSLMKPPDSLAAYDCYLRAIELDRKFDLDSSREGLELAKKAIELDPRFARAHAVLAMTMVTVGWFRNDNSQRHLEEVLRIAKTGVSLDPQDSFCHWALGLVYIRHNELALARDALELALKLNPHDAVVWTDYAWYYVCIGEPQKALQLLDEREVVDPIPPNWHWEIRGEALYGLRRYAEAVACFERIPNTHFWIHRNLAACHGQLGNIDKAQRHWTQVLEVVPDAKAGRNFPTIYASDPTVKDHWYEGLQKAGLTA